MKTNWPTKKLGGICEIISPGVEKFDEIKKYVATADVDFDKIVNFTEVIYNNRPSRANMKVKENNVLVARMAETKKFLMADKKLQNDYIFSTGFAVLRTKKDLLPKYIFYFLYTKNFDLQKNKLAVGATQKAINNPALKKIKIPVPSLSIQRKIVERLDVIKKAQELNGKQIKLAEELFQSLLNKKLNPKGKNWKTKRVKQILSSKKFTVGKLKRSEYQESGEFPIIDQGNNDIAGYSDNKDLVYSGGLPAVIYGDHTRIVKYVDFPFIIGADGVKILNPKKEILSPKYLYYALHRFNIESRGYKRHFPILKEKEIPLLPIETQKRIVEKLSTVQDYKKKLLEQKQKLQELFDSILNKSFKDQL